MYTTKPIDIVIFLLLSPITILLLPYNHSCMQLSGAVLYFFINYMDIALQIFPNLSKIVPNSVPLTLYYYVI